MQLPTIDECAKQMHRIWREERVASGESFVVSELTGVNLIIPWGDLPEDDKDKYRTEVRKVYTAVNKINFKNFAED